jgi:ketosteroid isomerase-like protein
VTPELRSIRDRIQRDLDRLVAALDGLDAEQASWKPVPDASTLLQLARHVLGGTEQVVTSLAGGMHERDRDREFLEPGTPEQVRAFAAAARERIAKAFESIDPDALDRPVTSPAAPKKPPRVPAIWSGGGAGPSGRDKLLERVAHVAEHAGHAELTRDLLRAKDDELREKNLDTVRRFFKSFQTSERRPLWAPDALFEMPFDANGPVSIQGLDAITRESDEFWAKVTRHDYVDLAIHPTVDPGVFWVTVKSETVDKARGERRIMQLVNYLRLVDGKVVHRVEYFNPLALPH